MKSNLLIAGAVALIASAAACSGGNDSPSGNAAITGAWQRVSGSLSLDFEYGTIRYLDLRLDGSGTAVVENGTGGVYGCPGFLYASLSSDAVEIDFDSLWSEHAYGFKRDGSTLTLTDALGQQTIFTRVSAVPADSQCTGFSPAQTFTLSQLPDDRTGLAFDGTDLWYSAASSQSLQAIHPATGSTGAQIAMSFTVYQYSHLRTMQGNTLWLDCGCGHNNDIQHWNAAGTSQLDTVTTELFLPEEMVIRDAKFDGDSLWLTGDRYDGQTFLGTEFVDVNSDAEPDTLNSRVAFGSSVQSFAFHKGQLWAISYAAGHVLTRIDTSGSTWRAVGSIPLPHDISWSAIATDGTSLWIIGRNYQTSTGTLVRMEVGS